MCLVYHMMNNQPSYRVRNRVVSVATLTLWPLT